MDHLFTDISLIVAGAALLAWLASLTRQPILIGYVLCGLIVGPSGLGYIEDMAFIDASSRIGITLLLFLAGMVLHPQRAQQLFRKTIIVTLLACLGSWLLVFLVLLPFGFTLRQCTLTGLALMFSSTILVIKLLPTTTLHQRHMGSVCIAVLIVQDLMAAGLLLWIGTGEQGGGSDLGRLLLKTIGLITGAVLFEQYGLRRMMRQSEAFHEVLYMLCLGWCLGLAVLAEWLGLSYEIGAFLAGVTLARSAMARFLTEQLKPIRDFFLMFFFFVLGTRLDLHLAADLWLPVLVVSLVILFSRPLIYYGVFRLTGEGSPFARVTGTRLGQASEFGLIIAVAAQTMNLLDAATAQLIQLSVICTMILSSYYVIYSCPTPLGTRSGLKQD